jgi:hypothetical protein
MAYGTWRERKNLRVQSNFPINSNALVFSVISKDMVCLRQVNLKHMDKPRGKGALRIMKKLMTINLTDEKPCPKMDSGEFTPGQQATIYCDDEGAQFWYRFHGVSANGAEFETEESQRFDSKGAALSDAVEVFHWKMGC